MNDGTCSVDGCERSAHTRGMCKADYQRWYVKADPSELYYRRGEPPRPCAVDGCPNNIKSGGRGYCGAHYRRLRLYGDPLGFKPKPPRPVCRVEECDQPAMGRDRYCAKHHARWVRTGDPLGLRGWHSTHGKYSTPEYRVWAEMKQRCSNPKGRHWHDYGGRGITVCERWEDFASFYADMGQRPSPLHTLDRIDNDAGYYPANCRWATRTVQQRNRRVTRMLTYEGQTLPVIEWAEARAINHRTLLSRLDRGWSAEQALSKPSLGRGH